MKTITPFLLLLAVTGCGSAGSEGMTAESFSRIVATPGDSTPLNPQLAAVPFWSSAVCSNYLKYQDGRVFIEQCSVAAKTVQGRYVVFTIDSHYYKQPMHGILTFDEKAQAYKQWALFGTNVTESTVIFDFEKRVSASTGRYDPGFMEISVGTFSGAEASERALAYKDGMLFLTRDSTTRAAPQSNPEQAGAANRSQPIRLETNRTSSAADSDH